jgi:choline dehydrogenase-like flavoprotein
MIIDGHSFRGGEALSADVAVVGAGPAGIVVALELARGGYDSIVIESGETSYRPEIQQLAEAAEWDAKRHAPMWMASRRQLGGASVIWGGRCVPFDPVDFESRPEIVDLAWPIGYRELQPLFQRACDWLVCGRPVFDATAAGLPPSLAPGLKDEEVRTSELERWSLPTNFGREYRAELERSPRVRLVTGLTCTQVVAGPDGSSVQRLDCRSLAGSRVQVAAKHYIVACGGLESTRLLLASPGRQGRAIGDHSGHLGRWYMGHLEGVAAKLHLLGSPKATIFGYERDVDGVYVRRRFTFTKEFQRRQSLPNIVSWIANPELADDRHRSGELSLAYLALRSPLGHRFAPDAQRLSLTGEDIPGSPYAGATGSPIRHLENILRQPLASTRFGISFGVKRFLARPRRVPGFFAYNARNVYPLQYHGEHTPHRESRVSLADDRDALGMPRLRIDVRFSQADVDGVIRAHECWDAYLRRSGQGRLEYVSEDVAGIVWKRLGAGFHQSGTTRMSIQPEDGVVNPDLAVHGVSNLWVASSSTFVTSSQANSTFMIVLLALRLADHLRRELAPRSSVAIWPAVSSGPRS